MKLANVEKAAALTKQRERLLEGLKRIRGARDFNGILEVRIGGWNVLEIWRADARPPSTAEKVGKKNDAELTYLLKHVQIAFEKKVAKLDIQLRRLGVTVEAPPPRRKKEARR
jgi:hypothetical protein